MPSNCSSTSPRPTWMERVFQHHAWSNRVLIDFLASLTDTELALTVPATYGDSVATIRHIVASNADYARIIPDLPDVPQVAGDGPFTGWEHLREVAQATDAALVHYVAGSPTDYGFVDVDEDQQQTFELTRSMLLCQIIHHATEHRSQIRTTLSAHGISPPEISTWAWRLSSDGADILSATPSRDHEADR